MKIIDFDRRGNVVRFYYGNDDCTDYHGDDWGDSPYDSNAGIVYDGYIRGYIDVAWDLNHAVLEPCDTYSNYGNCGFSKNDMKRRDVPCIIVIKNDGRYYQSYDFNQYVGSDNVLKFYFGDDISKIPEERILDKTKL